MKLCFNSALKCYDVAFVHAQVEEEEEGGESPGLRERKKALLLFCRLFVQKKP